VRLAPSPVVLVAHQHQRVDPWTAPVLVGDAHLGRLLLIEQAVRDQVLQHHLQREDLVLTQLNVVGCS
jgi:hypothetical protein